MKNNFIIPAKTLEGSVHGDGDGPHGPTARTGEPGTSPSLGDRAAPTRPRHGPGRLLRRVQGAAGAPTIRTPRLRRPHVADDRHCPHHRRVHVSVGLHLIAFANFIFEDF